MENCKLQRQNYKKQKLFSILSNVVILKTIITYIWSALHVCLRACLKNFGGCVWTHMDWTVHITTVPQTSLVIHFLKFAGPFFNCLQIENIWKLLKTWLEEVSSRCTMNCYFKANNKYMEIYVNYIRLNTEKRQSARNKFEENLFKLMNNSAYGKTYESKEGEWNSP